MTFDPRNGRIKTGGVIILFCAWLAPTSSRAQDLSPRAYVITPIHSHAVTVSYSFNDGAVLADPTLPIEDAKGRFHLPTLSYYHGYSLFGRSSNFTVSLPYAFGNFQGNVGAVNGQVSRSGLGDARMRFSVNLMGGRAMSLKEMMSWRQRFLLGASLTVSAPTGQYDPARVINMGVNRWGFKPEIGASRRWGNWMLDAYGGIWFFTANNQFYPGPSRRTQNPIFATEGHLSYRLKPRLWASFDGNFWVGGRSTVDGEEKNNQQKNSRIGATLSLPLTRNQALKCSFSDGAYVTRGGDYTTITVAWQYSWVGQDKK